VEVAIAVGGDYGRESCNCRPMRLIKRFMLVIPPGTSKWKKIEHRMFSFISKNWRAKPLTSIEVVVNLIANTTTGKGLKINAKMGKRQYQKAIKITDQEMESLNIKKNEFKRDWNYIISP